MARTGELVEFIAKSIVDNPGAVTVNEQVRGRYVTCELNVAQEDMGRVIGKRGRMANAIRALIRVSAVKTGKRVTLEIGD